MHPGDRPDTLEARLVFRAYGWSALGVGLFLYSWGAYWLPDPHLASVPWGKVAFLRISAALLTASGMCAVAFSRVDDVFGASRALAAFAAAHVLFGAMFFAQWYAILEVAAPPIVGLAPSMVGAVLMYLALVSIASPGRTWEERFALLSGERPEHLSLDRLRSGYVRQIRHAARQEERARLARDLHDAVKQQLFAIQTAAATAAARIEHDVPGTTGAITQIRRSARDALTEMQALIDQLQAEPVGIAGLVEALRRQCEALSLRTGADVRLDVGELPEDRSLSPDTREALFRVAQEALANAARHARARHVCVSLGVKDAAVALTVRDDGQGVRTMNEGGPGMGLRNMRARAAETGGRLEVASVPGSGTAVRLTLPYEVPSVRGWWVRAGLWTLTFVASLAYIAKVGIAEITYRPVPLAITLVAAVAALRYVVAIYRARRLEFTA